VEAAPVNAVLLNKSVCVALVTSALGGGAALPCLGGPAQFTSGFPLMAGVLGDKDDVFEYEDLVGIDLDGNQVHDRDGMSYIVAFVDDQSPIRVDVPDNGGTLIGPSGSVSAGDLICQNAGDDPDCETGAPGADGIVVFALCSGPGSGQCGGNAAIAERGEYRLTIEQEQFPFDIFYTVVGEPRKLELQVFETTIGAGIEDRNSDGDLSDDDECPLQASVAGFTAALGHAQKTIVIARVSDNDDTNITASWITWDTSDHETAVVATDLTPTLDLGSFGFGAPNIICGTDAAGVVDLIANVTVGPAAGLDAEAGLLTREFEITVVGPPDNVALAAAPATLACDGTASSEVSATVTDSEGNLAPNGTNVRFDVQVLGVASPITATTTDGVAKTKVTPNAIANTGVPVVATTGVTTVGSQFIPSVTSSILVQCGAGSGAPGGGAAPPPGGGPGGTPGGVISPPDTGSAGDLDGHGALNVWMAVALFAGAMGLVGARLALRMVQ
jgi:hypothetical protein